MQNALDRLSASLDGALYYDQSVEHYVQLIAYSTDASVYQERPLAVALPQNINDIKKLIAFAIEQRTTLIPRAAGTSLAGQVVGNGIVVDISKYFTRILEVNVEEKWVRVQPGVIRDDLNKQLRQYGLMFGPETSTSSRAMIGGMIGNNSCGLHSIVWGDVRSNLLAVKGLLSDGTEVVFENEHLSAPTKNALQQKINSGLLHMLDDRQNQSLIRQNFPKANITRRNTGYALDSLLDTKPFSEEGEPFNMCKLVAGSEGTLVFVTEAKLKLIDLPPRETALVCVHCNTLQESLHANIVALRHTPMASELVDRYIMNFTREHPEYQKNCFFVEGDPAALLMVEFMEHSKEDVTKKALGFIEALQQVGLGYAYPVLYNEDVRYAWDIRKAGLGLLRNLPGDTQPVNLIEDCAVAPEELPAYINDLQDMLQRYNVNASYYAHAGAGELHVEPMINLKTAAGRVLFRTILAETVQLVKKYQGSLSGEHGDGRLRGEYIAEVVGEQTNELFKRVKQLFDPHGIFNKGKITETAPMDSFLRTDVAAPPPVKTYFDFSETGGILRLAEKCSGSGDCRKTELTGGTMCPSYMATRKEKDTTRARANVLRQMLTQQPQQQALAYNEIKDVMDLCLSCKACKTECPSAVDIAKMKAEFLQHYYDKYGIPFRSKMIGNFAKQMKLATTFRVIYNWAFGTPAVRKVVNKMVGFHPQRTMPLLHTTTLRTWLRKRPDAILHSDKKVVFFCDEFTNYYDTEIGQKAVLLLEQLGYSVSTPEHKESGRSFLSKGMVKHAAAIANHNIRTLSGLVSSGTPIIGVEPSAILTLRDEYVDLADANMREQAKHLANCTFTIEEFLATEFEKGRLNSALFTSKPASIVLHGHCYQKALSSQHAIVNMLSIPPQYQVQVIPSGCCGMAGAFGYEAEHFEVSQQIGELVLFPTIRNLKAHTLIAASGTSCRHQIKDGTGRHAKHPVEILYEALLQNVVENSTA